MLLIHPKPQPGEALTSWLVRTSESRGLLLHILTQQLVGKAQVWTRDVDLLAPDFLLAQIARMNGVSIDTARITTLRKFEGVLDETISGNNQSPMVRPLGVFHRKRQANGQQACPLCLQDEKPYFRLNWRLRLVTACTRHGVVLVEECARCNSPIVPHRGGLLSCHNCRADVRETPVQSADSRALQLQYECEKVLAGHAVVWPFLKGIEPITFFRLQLFLLRAIASKTWGKRLRSALEGHVGQIPLEFKDRAGHLRSLTVASAHQCMRGVELLLRGWPAMFAGICQEGRAWGTWIVPEERETRAPYCLRIALDTYLRPGSANNHG